MGTLYRAAIPVDGDYTTQILSGLVRINSVNPALVPGAPGESEVAEFTATAMRELGLTVSVYEPELGRVSVVGVKRGAGKGRSLMLNAHYDTVGVEGMNDPFSAAIRGTRLYGRGAYDMKGSLAACLGAVKALEDAQIQLPGDLVVAAVADEEHASIGTADLIPRLPVGAAIVTEPTQLNICLVHKGFVWLEIETLGRAAHGSRPEEGVDANMRMGRVLAALQALEAELSNRPPQLGRTPIAPRRNAPRRDRAFYICGALRPGNRAPHDSGRDRRGRHQGSPAHAGQPPWPRPNPRVDLENADGPGSVRDRA